jgi:hypothetical protein
VKKKVDEKPEIVAGIKKGSSFCNQPKPIGCIWSIVKRQTVFQLSPNQRDGIPLIHQKTTDFIYPIISQQIIGHRNNGFLRLGHEPKVSRNKERRNVIPWKISWNEKY